jgi:hypothetical protein
MSHPDQQVTEQTWTFVGHWENDRIVVEYAIPGNVEDERIDTGYWEQGLWAAPASGATIEEAQAAAIAEYEDDEAGHTCERCGAQNVPDGNFDPDCGLCDDCTDYNASRVVL